MTDLGSLCDHSKIHYSRQTVDSTEAECSFAIGKRERALFLFTRHTEETEEGTKEGGRKASPGVRDRKRREDRGAAAAAAAGRSWALNRAELERARKYLRRLIRIRGREQCSASIRRTTEEPVTNCLSIHVHLLPTSSSPLSLPSLLPPSLPPSSHLVLLPPGGAVVVLARPPYSSGEEPKKEPRAIISKIGNDAKSSAASSAPQSGQR